MSWDAMNWSYGDLLWRARLPAADGSGGEQPTVNLSLLKNHQITTAPPQHLPPAWRQHGYNAATCSADWSTNTSGQHDTRQPSHDVPGQTPRRTTGLLHLPAKMWSSITYRVRSHRKRLASVEAVLDFAALTWPSPVIDW